MPAIARITTHGRNYWRDRERLVECLRDGLPFYMASTTGGPITPGMSPSLGRLEVMPDWHEAVQSGAIDYIVWSYETPIFWRLNGRWIDPGLRYSRTTTQHQHIIRMATRTLED